MVCFDDCQFNEISKLLLGYGAQVDLRQEGGGSGHFEVAQLLLNNGAQVDMQDDPLCCQSFWARSSSWTPLK